MRPHPAWMLTLLLAVAAQAQRPEAPAAPLLPPHPNSTFARTPFVAPLPSVDPQMVVTPPDDRAFFIRRWDAGADTVHAYLRLLPGTRPNLNRTPFAPLPDFPSFGSRADSSVVPLFQLPDSLRAEGLRGLFERQRPGARLESNPDSARQWLRRIKR